MQYPAATEAEITLAQVPHNLFVSGLFRFDLLMAPAVIVLDIGMAGLLIPLALRREVPDKLAASFPPPD
ncbi:hypothetical protein [Candidatus Ferrigenium straubiae]|uniref:hypothetical protein n=1 Tax=Candidatus Ferrigenium straubiae TaxID=2919506 RepID=UPI003F4AF2BF